MKLPFAGFVALLCAMSFGAACTTNNGGEAGDVVSDGAMDACGAPMFIAMTRVDRLALACGMDGGVSMSDGAAGSLSFAGAITINNTGSVALGPVTGSEAHVTDLAGTTVHAVIALQPFTLNSVAAGGSGMVTLTATGVVTPSSVCGALSCSGAYRVIVPLLGACLPASASAASEPTVPACM